MTITPVVLAPIRRHPELAAFDDDRLHLFADVLGVDLIRDWDGALSSSLADAWRIREHLDAERVKQAQADEIVVARAELDQAAQLGPLRRRLERNDRRIAAHAALDAESPFVDERHREWERKADEKAALLFAPSLPVPEVDNRTSLERLKAKEARA